MTQYSKYPVIGGGGSGTVTSVTVTVPSILSVTGSPVTTSGTIALSLSVQIGNTVFASPADGSSAAPTFRSLVAADIANSIVIGKVLTGYSSGAGTVSATDTILQAINKLNGNALLLAPLASPTFTGTTTTGPIVESGTATNTFKNTAAGSVANFSVDTNAGDSANGAVISVGNSGTNQGKTLLTYNNAAAAGSPTSLISFQPRNNADTTNINPANITFTKTAAADTASVAISNTNGNITLASTGNFSVSGVLTAANIIDSGLTASTAVYADASKQLTSSATTSTELGYVSGVTSAIQTQLNARVTAITIASSNGFAGSSSGGATPALTLTTSITGILKGNGTAISAATVGSDYSVGTASLATGILKSTTSTGALSIAVAGDFPTLNQNTTGTASNVTGVVAAANGGTGQSSYATGDMLYASGATTLSKLAIGTLGQVHVVGAGSVPVYRNFIDPSSIFFIYDDFTNDMGSGARGSTNLTTSAVGSGSGAITLTPAGFTGAHPGIMGIQTGTTTTGSAALYGDTRQSFFPGYGVTTIEFCFCVDAVSDGTNTFKLWMGLMPSGAPATPTKGIYFTYTHSENSGNLVGNCTTASTTTSLNCAAAVGVNPTLKRCTIVVNAAATSVEFFVAGVSQGTISTNIPTGSLTPYMGILKSAGTVAGYIEVDYYMVSTVFTTPR